MMFKSKSLLIVVKITCYDRDHYQHRGTFTHKVTRSDKVTGELVTSGVMSDTLPLATRCGRVQQCDKTEKSLTLCRCLATTNGSEDSAP